MRHLFLVPACLTLAALFIAVERSGRPVAADVVKGVASSAFVLLGFLGAGALNASPYALTIVGGLLSGAVADVLIDLRHVFEGHKSRVAFFVGTSVFLVGHIVYLLPLVPACGHLATAIAVGLMLAGALVAWIAVRVEAQSAPKAFGALYMGTVTVLACVAWTTFIEVPAPHAALFALGVTAFLVSDVMLVLNTFGSRRVFAIRVASLMLYYVGQILIALSLQLP